MRSLYCIWALLLLLTGPAVAGQAATAQSSPAVPPATVAPSAGGAPRTFVIFLRGSAIGREELTVATDSTGFTLTAQARIGAPVNIVTRRAEARYRSDWSPESLVIDGTVNAAEVSVRTTFKDGSAVSVGTDSGAPVAVTQAINAQTFALPSLFFTAPEALGRKLAAGGDTSGEFRAFLAPGVDVAFRVRASGTERMQTGTSTFEVRSYELAFANASGELIVNLATDINGALVRLSVPAQSIEIVREDVATATARTQIYSNSGDEAVMIPAAGFNLGATLTRPRAGQQTGQLSAALPARLPAVVLLSGSGAGDRDGYAAGIPILGQLAGAIADAGFVAVRYDKRGSGQSGGRSESVTLSDYAEDARAVVNWLAKRKDIDPKRISIVGHSEGAWVALLTAAREKRIAAVALLAAPAATGAELVLEQQRRALDLLNAPPAEREEKIALQRKIQAAVLSGTGWEGVPPALRRQADIPWFQSLLAYNPATVVDDVRQPMLFVHGQLDRQVPIEHLETIADLARRTSKSKSVEVVSVIGINHLLVPAVTGEVTEYSTLTDRNISRDVTGAITAWLTKTHAVIK